LYIIPKIHSRTVKVFSKLNSDFFVEQFSRKKVSKI